MDNLENLQKKLDDSLAKLQTDSALTVSEFLVQLGDSLTKLHTDSKSPASDFLAQLGDSLAKLHTDSTSTASDFQSLIPPVNLDFNHQSQKTGDIDVFLGHDLKVERLNQFHKWLPIAGLPKPARPLHYQVMMGRQIIITEQVDLHLIWGDSGIFIKPLPRYLLDSRFWKAKICSDKELYRCAFGLLQSYLWLIQYESDFKLATDESKGPTILPSTLKWDQWRSFAEIFPLQDPSTDDTWINKRYKFGELRVGRLNLMWRILNWYKAKDLIHGYYHHYQHYNDFFSKNFAWLIVIFAYVTVVLTAMQLGISLDSLGSDKRFQRASFGFAIFSIIVPVATVGVVIALFVILFVDNAIHTCLVWRRRRLIRKMQREE